MVPVTVEVPQTTPVTRGMILPNSAKPTVHQGYTIPLGTTWLKGREQSSLQKEVGHQYGGWVPSASMGIRE